MNSTGKILHWATLTVHYFSFMVDRQIFPESDLAYNQALSWGLVHKQWSHKSRALAFFPSQSPCGFAARSCGSDIQKERLLAG